MRRQCTARGDWEHQTLLSTPQQPSGGLGQSRVLEEELPYGEQRGGAHKMELAINQRQLSCSEEWQPSAEHKARVALGLRSQCC